MARVPIGGVLIAIVACATAGGACTTGNDEPKKAPPCPEAQGATVLDELLIGVDPACAYAITETRFLCPPEVPNFHDFDDVFTADPRAHVGVCSSDPVEEAAARAEVEAQAWACSRPGCAAEPCVVEASEVRDGDGATTTFTFDEAGRLASAQKVSAEGQPVSTHTWTYDESGIPINSEQEGFVEQGQAEGCATWTYHDSGCPAERLVDLRCDGEFDWAEQLETDNTCAIIQRGMDYDQDGIVEDVQAWPYDAYGNVPVPADGYRSETWDPPDEHGNPTCRRLDIGGTEVADIVVCWSYEYSAACDQIDAYVGPS